MRPKNNQRPGELFRTPGVLKVMREKRGRVVHLDEAFFQDARTLRRPERVWVLPLAPLLAMWGAMWLFQQTQTRLEGGSGVVRATSGTLRPVRTGPLDLGGGPMARDLRYAQALLARGDAKRARGVLIRVRATLAARRNPHGEGVELPFVVRSLARAERMLGHREQAAELYVILLQEREDDIEALKFFLAYLYEDDDLQGAMSIADDLQMLGGLDGPSEHLMKRIQAELLARAVVAAAERSRR